MVHINLKKSPNFLKNRLKVVTIESERTLRSNVKFCVC